MGKFISFTVGVRTDSGILFCVEIRLLSQRELIYLTDVVIKKKYCRLTFYLKIKIHENTFYGDLKDMRSHPPVHCFSPVSSPGLFYMSNAPTIALNHNQNKFIKGAFLFWLFESLFFSLCC